VLASKFDAERYKLTTARNVNFDTDHCDDGILPVKERHTFINKHI